MRRFYIALLAVLLCFINLSATVYPYEGQLFDISSSKCAIGRPLEDVLSELMAKTTLISMSTDTLIVNTSSQQKKYYWRNLKGKQIQWPELSDSDTLLYVKKNIHGDMPNGGLNDTLVVFGVTFTPGNDMTDRKVNALWVYFWYITSVDMSKCVPGVDYTWTETSTQARQTVADKASPDYLNRIIFDNECPTPGLNLSYFDGPDGSILKTGKNIGLYYYTEGSTGTDGYRNVTMRSEEYYVGNLNYCPVVEEFYDTLCRGDLPGIYNTKLTQSGTDTLSSVKTWYGTDSTVILHLVVNEPSAATVDTMYYTEDVTEKTERTVTKVYENAVGCDSIVTYNMTLLPKEKDTTEQKCDSCQTVPIIPDRYFSPNGDGTAELWHIQNLDLYNSYVVRIYDRFGREMAKYNGNFTGWDGKYKGRPQPSTDYWYSVSVDDADIELSGHFTLIR